MTDELDSTVEGDSTVAFVLSGGAALGAAQVGMLLALAEHRIEPDLVVGTSVGAVNGGWVAARHDVAAVGELAQRWQELTREGVFPARPVTGLLGFLGRYPNLVPASGLRSLISRNLRFAWLEDAPTPLHVIVADVLRGEDVRLSRGRAVDAITASAAIPAVFPPVTVDGHLYMDGGVVNNTPISHAVDLGATTIWVLSTGYACALPEPPKGALAMALHALSLTINQRLAIDVARYEEHVDLRVVPPLCPIRTTPADFSHAEELIDRSYESTNVWLHTRNPVRGQATLLEPHHH